MGENYEKCHTLVCVFLGNVFSTIGIKSGERFIKKKNGDGNL